LVNARKLLHIAVRTLCAKFPSWRLSGILFFDWHIATNLQFELIFAALANLVLRLCVKWFFISASVVTKAMILDG
jgi:hypothetical protein